MKKCIFMILLFGYFALFAEVPGDPEQLLLDSDAVFIPSKAKFDMLIENYGDGEKKQYYDMECFVGDQERTLIVFKAPGIMRGQSQLRLGDTLYNYVRKIDRISRVSARVNFQQSILSQEDVMSSALSTFYNIESLAEETAEDGRELYVMTLLAKNNRVAYAKIVAHIDRNTLLPVVRYYYSQSGQKIKELHILDIQKEGEQLSSVQIKVIDALKPDNYAIVVMDEFDTEIQIRDFWFTQQYMRAVN